LSRRGFWHRWWRRGAACGLLLTAAAASDLTAQPISVRDGSGQMVTVKAPVRRVASLTPSSVDIIVSLGAADRVAARTRYDTSRAVARAADVGGGVDPSVEVLLAARPDLLIAWKGQATAPVVSRVRALGVPVYLLETTDTAAMYRSVRDIGTLLGLDARAAAAAAALRAEFRAVAAATTGMPRLRAVYVISTSPVIIAAAKSYMAELVSVAGADNPFADVAGDFPTLSLESFIAHDPDVLIVGRRSGGGSQLELLRGTAGWRDLRAVRNGAVLEVNSEQWGRPTLHTGVLVRELSAALRQIPPSARRMR